uniref:Uncharacterized protein n=1 Tax=Dunaliella tertiolecta TaxID=3047 RepID=A0A7S3QKY0_DUNTE|mmetsp:Transcript_12768/g.34818  ORF Transcript_12768/g.34818 Transcript_12768/m.34818 type:complete len:231 (+) Transcript_12768:62-754(+)|eukprot:CAMPEP_0202409648 /NCGR_PEP_ID=MMETSP1128-20130828/17351_1 /ASSEMBLY_ACC=CAM_ASM_000463 /TAXON_ID=3047 /ORGANISM="Dunaliella tertiolecta, Strain CCMP1320" /LENGTH=230 /DNA_ID=CAMNT_0049015017 /DNA_START=21 /DNA_END=713 /DNA_ORIENTATION=+
MPRADGRGNEEFRAAFLKTKVLNQAKGSCYIELDQTKVMVGVFGPRQEERKFGFSETGRLNCEVRLTSFAAGGGMSKQTQMAAERNMSAALEQALTPSVLVDRFPKAVMDVYVMVLESDGSHVGAATTAASTALADASCELYDMVPACHVVRVNGSLLLDPTSSEEALSDGSLLLALQPSTNEVTQLNMTGTWSAAERRAALELAMGGCAQLKEVMRTTLLEAAAAAPAS